MRFRKLAADPRHSSMQISKALDLALISPVNHSTDQPFGVAIWTISGEQSVSASSSSVGPEDMQTNIQYGLEAQIIANCKLSVEGPGLNGREC